MVFLEHLEVAAEAGGGDAARAHGDEVQGQVFGLDLTEVDEAQQQVEVCRDAVALVEGAVAVVDAFAAVEGRVRGHEAEAHQGRAEDLRGVVSDAAFEVFGRHVVHVAIDSVEHRVAHVVGDHLEDVVRGVVVVRVEDADDVARRDGEARVHGVVDALVGFGDDGESTAEARLILPTDGDGVVCRTSILDDQFVVPEGLSEHALQRVPYGLATVIRRGDDRYLLCHMKLYTLTAYILNSVNFLTFFIHLRRFLLHFYPDFTSIDI